MDSKDIKRAVKAKRPFHNILIDLLKDRDESQADLAKVLSKSRQAVSLYCNGSEPDFETLVKIADHFHVSVDYLVGRQDFKTHDAAFISEQTGLDEKAISVLKYAKEAKENPFDFNGKAILPFISALLTSEKLGRLARSFVGWVEEAKNEANYRTTNSVELSKLIQYDKKNKQAVPNEEYTIKDKDGNIIGLTKEYMEIGQKLAKEQRKGYIEAGARSATVGSYEAFIREQYKKILEETKEAESKDTE